MFLNSLVVMEFNLDNLFTPRFSWNTAKVGVKHQSINRFVSVLFPNVGYLPNGI